MRTADLVYGQRSEAKHPEFDDRACAGRWTLACAGCPVPMRKHCSSASMLLRASFLLALAAPLAAQTAGQLTAKNASIAQTNFKGRSAIQVIAAPDAVNAASYA